MAVSVELGDPSLASGERRDVAKAIHGGHLSSILGSGDVPDVIRPAIIAQSTACPLPVVGGSVKVHTRRNSQGLISGIPSFPDSSTHNEEWTLVALGQTIAVLVDSGTIRLAKSNAKWTDAFGALVSYSDTAIVPFLNSTTRGLTDLDENGKLTVYVTGTTHVPNLAFVNSNMRTDCPTTPAPGEAIFLNWNHSTRAPRYDQAVVVHEMAHIADLGWRRTQGTWSVEGFANFVTSLFPFRASPDPLAINSERIAAYPDGSSLGCFWRLSEALSDAPFGGAWMYSTGCNLVGYIFQQYRSQFGGSLKDTFTAWSNSGPILTVADADTFLKHQADSSDVFAHWLLMWYADDLVLGTPPVLQHSMWNMRELWRNDYLYWGFDEYPLPLVRLTSTAPAASFDIGAPDAKYIEFTGSATVPLNVRVSKPSTTRSLKLVVLRVQ